MRTQVKALLTGIILATSMVSAAQAADKVVIAHRGASGYLPEHTLPAKAMAYAQGADYLEQDLVMTKDNELVVLHDHYLDRVTDVAERFPDRARKDGRYYAIDFTLAEIKSLKFTEGFEIENGKKVQGYPGRFPMGKSDFRVHTFQEEIEFVQGLNHSTGKNIGIYPEIKAPWFHKQEGKDISSKVLAVLKQYGYTGKNDNVYLQCFDANELKRIKNELEPKLGMDLKLVQLIAYNAVSYTHLRLYQRIPEFGGLHSLADLQRRIGTAPASLLIAEIAGQPAGFKLGYQRQETVFYSWLGGVLPAFRRHGVAQALLAEQERWARAQGYRQLTIKTRNRFRAMLTMLIAHHYQIVQLEKKGEVADYRLLLEKNL